MPKKDNEVIMLYDRALGKQLLVNTQPLIDLFVKTGCKSGKDLSREINKIKRHLVLGWNPDGHVDFESVQEDYCILEMFAKILGQFVVIELPPQGN